MRILTFIIKFSLVLLIFSALGYVIAREMVIYWGTSSFKNSLVTLRQSHSQNMHGAECLRRGSQGSESDPLVTYQLRFLNSRDYVLEAICSQFSLSPIVFERSSLPPLVTKAPGSSGFLWEQLGRSAVELASFEELAKAVSDFFHFDASFLMRTRTVVVDDREIIITTAKTDTGGGPVTSCEGYGYYCCQEVTEIGIGQQIVGLNECQDSCFAMCGKRPAILSFTSNPYFDAKARTLVVASGDVVEFLYVSDGDSSDEVKARLDFGDGVQSNLEGHQGSATHGYDCAESECAYSAILSLTDQWGVQSAQTELSKIKVVVNSQ